ncbi:major facilitator superfamily domain-containing protein [Gymnopilus junonius]|uniref:Major facilitator superfamily domain-containing protein n=1 Tax=Gymnopilus junonius TaxID=109634 RepID=A0A9P5NMF1_GYMJU|nr:major facilitator superfamily domain-containing protein [Gymnopilus junonius]
MASPPEKTRGAYSNPSLETEDISVDETRALLTSSSRRSSYDSADDTQSPKKSNPFFIEDLHYTPEEEQSVLRIIDTHLMPCILLTTFVLNMDRTNNSNAISDNLPADLGFDINVINTATAMYSVLFATACLTGAVIAKIVGPHRWIPILMFSWGLVTLAHVLITDKFGYLTVRCFIAITEGGVIPTTLVYLGGFYKSTELATRLALFWGVQHGASAVSGLMASGLVKLRGVAGLEGWKWLFLMDGIITVAVAIGTWFYLPSNLIKTSGGLRGRTPWFTAQQTQIAVTRLIRDDISKKSYDKTVKWSDIKDTLSDPGIVLHLIITSIGQTPNTPMYTYLPTVIKSFNFSVSIANALTAPPYLLQGISMILVIRHSDTVRERGYHGAFGAGWQLLGWIFVRSLPSGTGRGIKYLAAVFVASWPSTHPLNIAWMSENTGSVGKRTVASGLVIGASNIYGVWGSQIYRADDAPEFKRGNLINIAFASTALLLWFAQKNAYRLRNARHAAILSKLSEEELAAEEEVREIKGNQSPLFHFTT